MDDYGEEKLKRLLKTEEERQKVGHLNKWWRESRDEEFAIARAKAKIERKRNILFWSVSWLFIIVWFILIAWATLEIEFPRAFIGYFAMAVFILGSLGIMVGMLLGWERLVKKNFPDVGSDPLD